MGETRERRLVRVALEQLHEALHPAMPGSHHQGRVASERLSRTSAERAPEAELHTFVVLGILA